MLDAYPCDWREMLTRCHVPRDILAVCADRLDRLTPDELACLPDTCRPRHFGDAEELGAYAVDVKRAASDSDPRTREVAGELSAIFTDAMQRIAYITGPHRSHPAYENPDRR
jgi:hypothetical protein